MQACRQTQAGKWSILAATDIIHSDQVDLRDARTSSSSSSTTTHKRWINITVYSQSVWRRSFSSSEDWSDGHQQAAVVSLNSRSEVSCRDIFSTRRQSGVQPSAARRVALSGLARTLLSCDTHTHPSISKTREEVRVLAKSRSHFAWSSHDLRNCRH